MGNSKAKLLDVNIERRKKYDNAYSILGERIHRIPIKYVVCELTEHNWNNESILLLLIYLKQYSLIMEKDMYRINELNEWIDGLQYDINFEYHKVEKYIN